MVIDPQPFSIPILDDLKWGLYTFEFTQDQSFSSPSTAAVMVMGRNANGPLEWKLTNGKTLRDFENEMITMVAEK